MNLLQSSDLSRITGLIGMALLHFLWQGALLALLLAGLLLLLKNSAAAARYAAACGTLLLMSLCPIVTAVVLHVRSPLTAIPTARSPISTARSEGSPTVGEFVPTTQPKAAPIPAIAPT
jgi:hypothetical protein